LYKIIQGLKCSPELAEMFQGLFPPSERSPDSKYKGKNDGDTEHGKVNIENNIIFKRKEGYNS
jgi:hypothetical protein